MKKIYLLATTVIINVSWQPMILSMLSKVTKNRAARKMPRKTPRFSQPTTILGKRPRAETIAPDNTQKRCLVNNRNKTRRKKISILFDHLASITSMLTKDPLFKKKFDEGRLPRTTIIRHCTKYAQKRIPQPSNNSIVNPQDQLVDPLFTHELLLDNSSPHFINPTIPKTISSYHKKKLLLNDLATIVKLDPTVKGEIGIVSQVFTIFVEWAKQDKIKIPKKSAQLYKGIMEGSISKNLNYILKHVSKKKKVPAKRHYKYLQENYQELGKLLDAQGKDVKGILSICLEFAKKIEVEKGNIIINVYDTLPIITSKKQELTYKEIKHHILEKELTILINQIAQVIGCTEKGKKDKLERIVLFVKEHQQYLEKFSAPS